MKSVWRKFGVGTARVPFDMDFYYIRSLIRMGLEWNW